MATKLLDRADAARLAPGASSPSELWRIADADSNGVASARREAFHHAMIHAGYLVAAKTGKPYSRCPICTVSLA